MMLQLFRSNRALDEHATLASGDFLAGVIEQSPDAVVVLDLEGRVSHANASTLKLLSRPLDRVVGYAFRDFIIRSDRETTEAALRAAREGAPQRLDARIKHPEYGERIWSVATAAWRVAAATAGVVVTARDVTDQRRALEELTLSESRYRHLFEAASDAIMTFDALGRFTTVNDAAEVISGYTREELIGRFFGPLLAAEGLPRALIEFRRALSGQAGQFETIMKRKDGARRHLIVNYACPLRSREVLCMIRDATAEKVLQEQLVQSEKMAAIGQLVSGVAHELNNPLASISAFAQLLLADKRLDKEQRHSAEVVNAESRRAARIVHNLLTFARQHKAEKVPADINKIVQDTLELREYELNVRGVQLAREFDEDSPPVTMVDVHQLQQVLLNLITNAEQAMMEVERDRHRLTVRTRTLPDSVRVEVEDTGLGIAPEAMHQIFNPFFTTKPTGKGTGLGLSISLGIVSEHGGRIWAENVGGGTRFCVELPRVAGAAEALMSPMPSAPVSKRPSLRILVADDEESLRLALERFLSAEGHLVTTVSSGSEAIWRAEGDEIFDIVLLDMRMPDVSGKQVFDRWRRERRELSERVVFLTGDIVSADLQSFLEGTGQPYLPKPFEFSSILEVLPKARVA